MAKSIVRDEPPLRPDALTVNAELEERIRQRAFEIYQEHGMTDGHADDDWYQAENEIRDAAPISMKAAA